MVGPLLESGTLTEFEPLGVGGETLFGSATELRGAMQRRLGAEVAASFAVPQQNAYGDTLDWYAPEPGAVTPWNGLADEQRSATLEQVEALRTQVLDLSRQLISDDRPAWQTLGRLLEHAATIPDQSHIFRVGSRPVLAFWGFRQRGGESSTGVPAGGATIRPSRQPAKPGPGSAITGPSTLDPKTDRPAKGRGWWWTVLLVLLTLILLGGLVWYQTTPVTMPAGPTDAAAPPAAAVPMPPAEPPLEPLMIPSGTGETGSLSFLTGRWQARSDELIDSDSKRPIALAYELQDGVGEVLITEQSGTVCSASIDAAFTDDVLTLIPRGAIRCADRAPFFGVTVTCRPSTDRRAACTGSFPNGKVFQVELGRQQ